MEKENSSRKDINSMTVEDYLKQVFRFFFFFFFRFFFFVCFQNARRFSRAFAWSYVCMLMSLQECDRLIEELDRVAEQKIQEYVAKADETKKLLVASLNKQANGTGKTK
jgi:hypothetical protein